MRHTPLLLALSLLTPTLAGCPPVRGDDDDSSVGDDADATAEDLALTEGFWGSTDLILTSDSCALPEPPERLTFDLALLGGDAFTTDWGVDTPAQCTGGSGFFDCPATEFLVDTDPETTLRGSIAFDGEIVSTMRLEGTVDWVITCTGDCAAYDLPADTTCTFSLDAGFEPEDGPTEPDPDPEPPTAG